MFNHESTALRHVSYTDSQLNLVSWQNKLHFTWDVSLQPDQNAKIAPSSLCVKTMFSLIRLMNEMTLMTQIFQWIILTKFA